MTEEHPFATLAATWHGAGQGEYPTIDAFAYTDDLVITLVPNRPLAHWRSTTRDARTAEPRHAESGFLRSTAHGVELVVAHGFGILEATTGSFVGNVLGAFRPASYGAFRATPLPATNPNNGPNNRRTQACLWPLLREPAARLMAIR